MVNQPALMHIFYVVVFFVTKINGKTAMKKKSSLKNMQNNKMSLNAMQRILYKTWQPQIGFMSKAHFSQVQEVKSQDTDRINTVKQI